MSSMRIGSRPFSVAPPMPVRPSSVRTFTVTKLRPGQVTMTLMSWIFIECVFQAV